MARVQDNQDLEHEAARPALNSPPAAFLVDVIARFNPGMPDSAIRRFSEAAGSVLSALAVALAAEAAAAAADLNSEAACRARKGVTAPPQASPASAAVEGGFLRDWPGAPVPLTHWAGPVFSSSEVVKFLGAARATVQRWYERGVVIGLPKGPRNRVYPLEQFDGYQPVAGLPDVIAAASSHEAAWRWLVAPQPSVGGQRPIELLKSGAIDMVTAAARQDLKSG